MNKFYLLPLLVLLLVSNIATAQLESGTIAPNFTATDVNGNTYELYEVLAEGKTVVLDVFATWCPPCWSYHQDHVLEDLYQRHGPNGDNTMMIFGIEADSSTNMDDLQGNTSESLGNWLNGISYPIIDDASIGDLYNIVYFPTIYHICDSRLITETAQQPLDAFADFNAECPEVGGENNIGILQYTGYQGTICGTEVFAPAVQIQNLSESEVTSLDLALTINGELAEEINWTPETPLAVFDFTTIEFGEITTAGDTELQVDIVQVNGNAVTGLPNGTINVSLSQAAIQTQVIYLEIQTDDYAYENYWELTNEAGDVLASGGNPRVGTGGRQVATENDEGAYANNSLIVEELEIPDGCFFFTMYDDYADGMCCAYGSGYYTASDDTGNILLRGDRFEAAKQDKFFNDNPVGVQELSSVNSLNIAPNPAMASINVEIGLTEITDLNVAIFNNLGQKVKPVATQTYTSGLNRVQVDVSDLPSGIYFVNLQSEKGTKTKRFVVQR